MGALSINHKRIDDSSLINSTNSSNYTHQIDTNKFKKPRVCYSPNQVSEVKAKSLTAFDRFLKYPVPLGRLRKEVHAPCGAKRVGFGSYLRNHRFAIKMGNVFGCRKSTSVLNDVEKRAVIGVGKAAAVSEDSSEVVVVEDGNEARSVVSDERKGLGLGLLVESREFGANGVRNSVVHSTGLGRDAYKKLLSSVNSNYSHTLSNLGFEIKLNEAKWQSLRSGRKQREEPLQEVKKPEEDLLIEPFVPLSEDEEEEVKRAFLNANRRKVLVTHENSNIEITGEILRCLRPGEWLNDEVINVYLELLKERERREPKKYLNCHFFNTFFYKKLIGGRNGYDYKAVRRWTTPRKLGYKLSECDKIFVPIHKEIHWCLAVINKKDKTFQYLDSLGGRDSQVLKVLAKYYVDEVKDKCGEDVDVSSWELEYVEDLPEQQNGFDCGVFMIKYADFYSRDAGLHFSQENMPYFRRRTAKEILRLQAL